MSSFRARSSATRGVAVLAALGLVAAAGLVAGQVATSPERASAAVGECPPGTLPAPGTPSENPVWSDANVAVYAGGDFVADGGAAESEGVLVVEGDATFAKDFGGTFNVGWVGVGSQVAPPPGTTMLAVGGGLSVAASTILDVGSGAREDGGSLLGGNVLVGGTATPSFPAPQYELNNGSLTSGIGSDALAEYAGFGAELADTSADLAAATSTGTSTSVSGNQVTFTGNGVAGELQVFTITAAQASAITEVYFVNIADDAPVVINVTGGGAVTMAHTYYANDGVRADDFASPLFGMVAARTLWNYVGATSVDIAGSSQILGSILAPNADLDIVASTNGRVYAGGDIHMHGVGNELHNYPWISAPFDCVPVAPSAVGSITLQKLLAPGVEDFLPVGPGGLPKFSGTVTCPIADGTLVEEWTLRPPAEITIGGLPIGATCTITEDLSTVTQDVDGVDVPLDDFEWGDPEWTVNGTPAQPPVTFVVPASETELVAVIVTNELLLGSFTITKVVENPDDLDYSDAFTGTWSCTHPDVPADSAAMSGTWSLAGGETTTAIDVPYGSQCAVSEDAPAAPEDGVWTASISPASFTVDGETSALTVTATNTLSLQQGAFTIEKAVTGAGAPDVSFTGTWSCELPAGSVVEGSWTLAAGERTDPLLAPIGAVCDVTETAPAESGAGTWADPVITGSPVTITAASAEQPSRILVTNAFAPTDSGESDGELPATGGGVPVWIVWAGIGLLIAGAVVVATRFVRRRRP